MSTNTPAPKPDVRIYDDLDVLSQSAAVLFIESAARAIMDRGRFLVALSGGSTPTKLYDLLGASPQLEQVGWENTHVFWGDERCVPPEDLDSNYRQANDVLLVRTPIPPQNIHRIEGEVDPPDAAISYALTLKGFATPPFNWPRFDLVLLGMGDDGHTASLFPGSDVNITKPTAVATAQYQGRPATRITLTPPVFNAARRVMFLVSGKSKAQTLADVLYGKYRPELLPAQRIRPADGELIWLVDQAAAIKF